jgi:hypothetical protein
MTAIPAGLCAVGSGRNASRLNNFPNFTAACTVLIRNIYRVTISVMVKQVCMETAQSAM